MERNGPVVREDDDAAGRTPHRLVISSPAVPLPCDGSQRKPFPPFCHRKVHEYFDDRGMDAVTFPPNYGNSV